MIRPPRKPLPARPQELRPIVDASDTPFAFTGMVKDRILDWRRATEMSKSSRDSAAQVVQCEVLKLPGYAPEFVTLYVVDLERFYAVNGKYWLLTSCPRESIQDFDRSG